MKKVLLLDMDGPLADFDLKSWNLYQHLGLEMNISSLSDPGRKRFLSDNLVHARDRKIVRRLIEDGHNRWFRDLPVTEGAQKGVAELLDAGIDVWVCTKPLEVNDRCRDDKSLWLRDHFPELVNKMICAPDKGMVRGDVLLDDAPHIEWIARAHWEPVIFPAVFNDGRSKWAGLRKWTWGDPLETLI